MEDYNNIMSRYDAVTKQAQNFGIDAQRWYTVFDLKCQIALALGIDLRDVKNCLSVYDVDYLIYKTYGGELSRLDLMSDYDVLVATAAILDSGIDTSLLDSEFIAEMTLVDLIVPMSNEYFYLEPLSDNTKFGISRNTDGAPDLNLEYSLDGKTWQSWDYKTKTITGNAKERVYLRGQNEAWTTIVGTAESTPKQNSIISASDAQFNIGGRLSSLFTGNDEESDKSIIMSAIFYQSACRDASELIVPKNAKLSYAFQGCKSLISAPRRLSDTITHNSQYRNMFDSCESLMNAPELPAKSLTKDCYMSLFYGCVSLTDTPQIMATSLAESCFNRMYMGCSSLTKAHGFLADYFDTRSCYRMFHSCSSLTSFNFGDQSVYTSSGGCFEQMFSGCSKLSYIRCRYDDRDGAGPLSYTNWTSDVASRGTFVTNTNKWKRGTNGIPEGWEVVIE